MHACLGIILAGGQSSRMGQDKSLLQRDNQSMLEYSKQVLFDSGVDNIIVSGDGHDINDIQPQLGPLGGIASVLTQVPCQSALIIPVDLPFLTADVLATLKNTGQLAGCAMHYTDHPLPLYLPNNGFIELFFKQLLKPGQMMRGKAISIRAMLKQMPHKQIACKAPKALTNTNTPAQWQHAQQLFTKQIKTNVRSA